MHWCIQSKHTMYDTTGYSIFVDIMYTYKICVYIYMYIPYVRTYTYIHMHHCIHTYETCIKVLKRHCTILNCDPLFVWRVATPRPFAAQAPIAPALLVWRPQSAPMEVATAHRLRSILKTKTPKEDLEVLVLPIPFTWFLQFSKTWILKLINPVEMKPHGRYLHHAWKTTWQNSPRFYFVEKPLKQGIFNT